MPEHRRLRLAHLTTVDMSLALLLAAELEVDVEAGHDVFGISAPGPFVADVERLGVVHVPVSSFSRAWDLRSDARATLELFRAVRDLHLDVLHTHTPKAGVIGRIVGRLARVPVVVNTCHGLWAQPDDPFAKRIFVYGAEVAAAWFSYAELYQNDADRRTLSPFTPARAKTVGNGIDLRRFFPDPGGRAAVRRELGVSDEQILVGGVGRMVAEKGIVEFAAMATRLAGRAVFVWAGPDDPDKPDALDEVAGDVRFLGMRSDMPAFYSALDVFVLPSYREGFSRSAMEAAACGCALVLSDIRGCREIGRHEKETLLVPPGDASALTAAVKRLLDDAELRSRLAGAVRDKACREFDQRVIARQSLSTYAAVFARKRRRRGE